MSSHEIIGVIEPSMHDDFALRIKVVGSGVSFVKKTKELYGKEWLACFSQEDVAYIGFLNAAAFGDGLLIPIEYFPRKNIN